MLLTLLRECWAIAPQHQGLRASFPHLMNPHSRDVMVQDVQLELEETDGIEEVGQSSGALQIASLAPPDVAETVHSACLLDADPRPAGHLEPLPTSVVDDAEKSASSQAAHSPEEVNAAPLFLSACAREEKEKNQLWTCLNPPDELWSTDEHGDCKIPERSTGRPMGTLL